MKAGKTEIARPQGRSSIQSYVVQARSLVAPRKMHFYEGLRLPDLSSFRNERIEMPKRTKPRALNTGVIAAINSAAPNLAKSDPAVYVAFLMFSRLGLRNIKIRNAKWSWIENGRIGIIERPEENFYPKGSEGWVPISPDVLKELTKYKHRSTNDYIIPGTTPTERKTPLIDGILRGLASGSRIDQRPATSYGATPAASSIADAGHPKSARLPPPRERRNYSAVVCAPAR